ncbi:MAG: SoxR reducing system RseC family protein [Prevotellaceae bacterium]|jgi:sigma-E factor negative regulatory protein RseC|nr:SoxR reducing system RseC family protein [Prevotellaceae bacterium]
MIGIAGMAKKVSHLGKVADLTPEGILVAIVSESACASCHAKGACSMFDMKEKNILIPPGFQTFEIGETVNVLLRQSLGMKAVMYAYMIPLVVLVLSLVILISFEVSDLYAGLLSLGITTAYYIVLYFFRDKLDKQFSFELEKVQQ